MISPSPTRRREQMHRKQIEVFREVDKLLDELVPPDPSSVIPDCLQNCGPFIANEHGLHKLVEISGNVDIITVHPIGFFVSHFHGTPEGKVMITLRFLNNPEQPVYADIDNLRTAFPGVKNDNMETISEYVSYSIMKIQKVEHGK